MLQIFVFRSASFSLKSSRVKYHRKYDKFFKSRIANTSVWSYVYYLLYLSMLPRSGLNEIKQRVQIYTHTIMKVKNKNQIINHE